MATKTISITEEAYERLRMNKAMNESFTDVINRITGRSSIMELAGVLSSKDADKLEQHIKERRHAARDRLSRIKASLK